MKLFKDMDTEQFWLTLWTLAASSVMMLALIIGYCSYQEDLMVTGLIKDGHDPIELACMYSRGETLESACIILSQAKAKAIENDSTK